MLLFQDTLRFYRKAR
jgi:hypothetical protein